MEKYLYLMLTSLVWLFLNMEAFSQGLSRIGLDGQSGWIIPHSAELVPISQSHPQGFQFNWEYLPMNKTAWEHCNCFYYWGGTVGYTNFNHPKVLGNAYFLSGYFEPILWRRKDWQISIRGAMGVTHLTRVFDANTNPQNTFFSSPVSFLLSVSPKINYQLHDNWSVNTGFNYNHISNGGQRQPNRGMNFPGFGLGLSYWFTDEDFPEFEKPPFESRSYFILEGFGTFRDNPAGSGRLPAIGITADLMYAISRINNLGIGLESTWDQSLRSNRQGSGFIPALFISHHLTFGKMDFSQRMAYYLSKPDGYQEGKLFYQRYSLSYQFKTGFRLGADMKVHGHVAENIGFRAGWLF
ncbi:acyloxyacyl hydrolase [Cyclobacterium sp.]|uniref:acyloxyacyl hydrolase n=1 Tax=Cyclobacterium sp. TaxID=1966343 RepID=UPI001995FA51|nr:acyloxyacyl hydrolase [Cyclobacterium sp.]MBD3628873.1 acyloxyacyl hydrolase [Cyclobacterium sp.]